MGRCRRAAAASAADVGEVGDVVDVGDVGESCGSAPVLAAPAGFVSSTGDAMLSVMIVLLLLLAG